MPVRFLLALLTGVLFAFAFPSVGQGWLALIALAPLLVAIVRAKSVREAFFLGWASMAMAWLIMVPWVVRVMSHYGGLPYVTGVALFVAMALYLGLYGALFAAVVKRLGLGARFAPWLLVPLAWAAVEYLRTFFLTGFPWNLIAAALIDFPTLIQIDRFAGPYFTGALILIPAVVVAWLITQRTVLISRVLVIGGASVLLLVWWGTGLVASKLNARPRGGATFTAALLQPNISQEMRWNEENVVTLYKKMIDMTVEAADRGATVIIWPESTVPLSFTETAFYRSAIEELSRERGLDIILGSVATDPARPESLWNSAFLVSGGRTIGRYDKIRLVPFGEYVPLRRLLFFAKKLVHAVGQFEFGTNEMPLAGKAKYGPAICYEIVYPQITRTQIRNGADVLVTITNDAWYDGTSAPEQHLRQARLRAIEGDRYLLRAGTTGISAFIDPTGHMLSWVPMGKEGILYANFELRTTVTPYVRFGDWFAWSACVVIVAMLAMGMRRRTTA
ncbi:MAG: apolipoprotein N-acyltransferase [Acidobacteriota bacterium]